MKLPAALPQVLEPFQQDVLVSWLLLVMVTLRNIGLARDKCAGEGPEAVTVSLADMAQGMEAYMGSTLGMYDEGYTLERLLGLQSMVGQVGAVAGGSCCMRRLVMYMSMCC